jgi:ABC-type uncharacterized transport system permease subunit
MNGEIGETSPPISRVGSALAGVFAGAIVGSLVQVVAFSEGHDGPGVRLPWLGCLIGGFVVGLFGLFVGNIAMRGTLKRVVVGFVIGLASGVIGGGVLLPAAMTVLQSADDKDRTAYQILGLVFGVPSGAVLGMIVGFIVSRIRRSKTRAVGE